MHSDMQLALLFLLLIQMHMKTHCFQHISSKEDILSLKIHSLFSAQSLLVLNSVCPMNGVCIVRTSKWLDIIRSFQLPAIPVKAPTRKSAPGRVHGKNPQKCAHGPVFCTSEVTHAGSVPNNPPMGQLLGETMDSITCVINTLSGTWRSNEGATYYFTKYCCVK